jgi:hypothetical protein
MGVDTGKRIVALTLTNRLAVANNCSTCDMDSHVGRSQMKVLGGRCTVPATILRSDKKYIFGQSWLRLSAKSNQRPMQGCRHNIALI